MTNLERSKESLDKRLRGATASTASHGVLRDPRISMKSNSVMGVDVSFTPCLLGIKREYPH